MFQFFMHMRSMYFILGVVTTLRAFGETDTAVGIVKNDKVGLQENVTKDSKAVIAVDGANATNAVRAAFTVLGISNEDSRNSDLVRTNGDGVVGEFGAARVQPEVLALLVDTLGTSNLPPVGRGSRKGNDSDRGTSVGNGVDRLAANGSVEQTVALSIGKCPSVDDVASVFAAVDVTEVVRTLW